MELADPAALDSLAARLDGRADEVREQYRAFRAEVDRVAWRSAGAERYRAGCDRLCTDLEGNARELNDAADDLRAHARAVRERLDWMDDMVERLRRDAEQAWDDATGAFVWGADQVAEAWDTVARWR